MMGMSSPEWSRYMHEEIGVPDPPEQISAEVVRRLEGSTGSDCLSFPGALDAVRRLAARWPLAIASSSNRPLIDLFLELTGTAGLFRATVSSEEVERGKPAPDVYLEAARGWGRSGALRGDRGLGERHPLGRGGRDEGDRDPEHRLPAGRRGSFARRAVSPLWTSSRPVVESLGG